MLNLPVHSFFFFNVAATTEIYTLSLHDALPISASSACPKPRRAAGQARSTSRTRRCSTFPRRSEEHTSELQSRGHLVCRLLLEKKKIESLDRSSVYDGLADMSPVCVSRTRVYWH